MPVTKSRYRRSDGTLPPLAGGAQGTATTPDAGLRDKLKRIEAEMASARDQRVEANREVQAAKDAYAGTDDLSTTGPEFTAAREKVAELGKIDDRLADLAQAQTEVLRMLGSDGGSQPDGDVRARGRQAVADLDRERAHGGWSSGHLFASDELRADLERAATTKSRVGGLELGEVASRDMLVADITGTPNMRRGEFAGVTTQLRRMLRLLDLMPVGTTDGNTVPYVQESGTFTAGETAEGGAKPESGLTYVDVTAPVQTIAAWQKLRKQVLADVPALQSIIDGRLRYAVQRRLEDEVLAGNGVDPNLQGILGTAGVGTVPFAANSTGGADLILTGITQVLLADAEASGVVLNPSDWQALIGAKAPGDGHYYSGGPFAMTPQVIWGIPVVASRVIPAGTALVGDWEIGAQLFIREGVNVLMSDSDQDDFIRNRVTLLAEMRAALAVWRPAAFSKVALAA